MGKGARKNKRKYDPGTTTTTKLLNVKKKKKDQTIYGATTYVVKIRLRFYESPPSEPPTRPPRLIGRVGFHNNIANVSGQSCVPRGRDDYADKNQPKPYGRNKHFKRNLAVNIFALVRRVVFNFVSLFHPPSTNPPPAPHRRVLPLGILFIDGVPDARHPPYINNRLNSAGYFRPLRP